MIVYVTIGVIVAIVSSVLWAVYLDFDGASRKENLFIAAIAGAVAGLNWPLAFCALVLWGVLCLMPMEKIKKVVESIKSSF